MPGKAFQIPRENLSSKWERIPTKGVDILMTHMPPYDILDQNTAKIKSGCQSLSNFVKQLRPKLHLFGHIHESYGVKMESGTVFVNGSSVKRQKKMNPPVVLDFDLSTRKFLTLQCSENS